MAAITAKADRVDVMTDAFVRFFYI